MKNPVLDGDATLISLTPVTLPDDTDVNKSEAGPATAENELTDSVSFVVSAVQDLSVSPKTSPQMKNISSERKPQTPPASTSQDKDSSRSRTVVSQEVYEKEMQKLTDLMAKQDKAYKDELEIMQNKLSESQNAQKELLGQCETLKNELESIKKEYQESYKSRNQLRLVLTEYERTLSQVLSKEEAEKKQYDEDKKALLKERDTTMTHLNNMEIAFNDVHQKYEKSKSVIEGLKKNEDILKVNVKSFQETLAKQEEKYSKLKAHATFQLEKANQELDSIKRSHEGELATLKTVIKRHEVRVTSLEEDLERKSKENTELTEICDELIKRIRE